MNNNNRYPSMAKSIPSIPNRPTAIVNQLQHNRIPTAIELGDNWQPSPLTKQNSNLDNSEIIIRDLTNKSNKTNYCGLNRIFIGLYVNKPTNQTLANSNLNSSPVNNNQTGSGATPVPVPTPAPIIDTTPPVRTNGQPTGILSSGITQVTISIETDEFSTCRYSTSATQLYNNIPISQQMNADNTGTIHTAVITGLVNGNTYNRYIRCRDNYGNMNTNTAIITFSIANSGGSTPAPAPTTRPPTQAPGPVPTSAPTPAPPTIAPGTTPAPNSDRSQFVVYPSPEIEFIIGPQLISGSQVNPWPWFDSNAITKGLQHGSAFPANPNAAGIDEDAYVEMQNYYDLGLIEYINYYRTGNTQFLTYARKITDSWWSSRWINQGSASMDDQFAPRQVSLKSMILRALEGRTVFWPWILNYVRYNYDLWLGQRINNNELYIGIREGGYILLYTAILGKVYPDPAIRIEMTNNARNAALNYYSRLQYSDGSFRWIDEYGDMGGTFEQPFMVGLLMEGIITTHKLLGSTDQNLLNTVIKSCTHLMQYYRNNRFTSYGGGAWRGMWYFLWGQGCMPPVTPLCGEGEPMDYEDKIREVRQLNPLLIHSFGYIYKYTGNQQYLQWGDELFASTYGNNQGPLSDQWYGLADYREKEYSQSYRSAGNYLAYRYGY